MPQDTVMKRLLLVIFAFLVVSACSRPQIAAFGSNSEIVIITSARCSDEANILRSILEREIVTVQYETAFTVRVITTGDIKPERNRKNIILLDYLRPESLISDAVLSLSGRDKQAFVQGEMNLKALHDRWAKGQVVMLVAAKEREDLNDLLARNADEIYAFVSGEVQERLNRALFDAGEQQAATKRLAGKYGWSLRLPTGYEIDESHASQRVIKILKDKPTRMITVYWEGGRWEDVAGSCLERKRMLAWEFWDQDEIVEETLVIEEGKFLRHDSTVLSGTWENKKYTIGGIYVTYCFACEECRSNYVVDAAVFAPGLDKLPLMRELKAILSTFTCCEQGHE